MSIDLSQFHQVFFEESIEGLDIMESSLMELDITDIDNETINAIFRAAHSIKGGSATFGFTVVAEFTHVLETLLDDVRDGKRGLSGDDVNLLLQSVDCVRDLLNALQVGEEPDTTMSNELKVKFEALLGSPADAGSESPVASDSAAPESAGPKRWKIFFRPGADTLKTGNDALRMLRELAELGALDISVDVESLPDFTTMECDLSYLAWEIILTGEVEEAAIEEVFEWVIDESILTIQALDVSAHPESEELPEDANPASLSSSWNIYFKPGKDILRTGNEPLRMLRELSELGASEVKAVIDDLPAYGLMEAESSYLAWNIKLEGQVTEEMIQEVFEWVSDESEIVCTQTGAAESQATPSEPVSSEKERSQAPVVEPEKSEASAPTDSAVKAAPKNNGATAKPAARKVAESSSIRVGIDKIDSLINMVGELVITQSMLGQLGGEFQMEDLPKLQEGLSQLEQNTRELQESVMRIRMLPISFAFSRFPRMVRDLSQRLGKDIDLELLGEQTELDKTVMEKIGDPLVHLVRNSVDHGIETIEERIAAGKPQQGKVTLNAFHQGGNVVIEIIDDGKGIARETIVNKAIEKGLVDAAEGERLSETQIFDLIFQPGFSTAAEVSDVSGRGVGMDVVRRNIADLNGTVELSSTEGKGSTITIRLPLTLAILDGQLIRVGAQTYIFPLVSIIESLQVKTENVNEVAGGCDVFQLRDEFVPIIRMYDVFSIEPDSRLIDDSLLVVVETEGSKVGVVVDELLAQQQVVIKSLEQNYDRVEGVSGATILGDGTVALILDPPGMVKIAGVQHQVENQVITKTMDRRKKQNSLAEVAE